MGSGTGHGRENHSRGTAAPDEALGELPKNFDPKSFESGWYAAWEDAGAFIASNTDTKPAYTIVIPPPNVTGVLHMGHALDNTLQDILIRFKRMDQHAALWVPGTDHAGIATQAVVEKHLKKEGLDRHQLGREKFLERVWQWKEESGSNIVHQLRRLGASCDWSRERFTLDKGLSQAVRKVFVDLAKEGLIYRSNYMVNWSPGIESAISDLEVEYKETSGFLVHFKYQSKDKKIEIAVATTRPETMLGDVAIGVHPEDPRYKNFHNQILVHPFIEGRTIQIIADDFVDPTFGTGAVKITPAHDPNDYEFGKRHNLDMITVLDTKGRIDLPGSPYHGLDRFKAREKIVEDLEKLNLFLKKEPHVHAVGHCQRTGVVVEPRISKQWFVKIESLAKPALEVVQNKEIVFVPENWTKTYTHWMENIKDWCISRQLWWGHRIPVWYCKACEHMTLSETDPVVCEKCASADIHQDEDVLDTWFSSALWPFSTLGWPLQTQDFQKFYPTTTLVTGFDIIFFWVARMIMMGLKMTGKVPFQTVHIHALIKDEHGQKMSKSKGNVVDPLKLMDQYGTDAFRFALCAFAAQGRDILLNVKRIEGYRNFMTKLWNASRFVLSKVSNEKKYTFTKANTLAGNWILAKLATVIEDVRQGFENMRFNESAEKLYQFVWNDYCDWYIELSKVDETHSEAQKQNTHETLIYCLETILKLTHPISPFITEEIYARLPIQKEKTFLMHATYPKTFAFNPDTVTSFEKIKKLIESIRNFRSENTLAPSTPIPNVYIFSKTPLAVLAQNQAYILKLCNIQTLHFIDDAALIPKGDQSTLTFGELGTEVRIPWIGLIDKTAEKERIYKVLLKLKNDQEFLTKRLSDPKYKEKAPAHLIQKDQEKLTLLESEIQKLTKEHEKL